MSGSFESMQWNACVHRLDLGLYSQPKEIWGTYVNSKGKCPLPEKFSPEEDQTNDAASSRTESPTHYQRDILPCLSPDLFLGCRMSPQHAKRISATDLPKTFLHAATLNWKLQVKFANSSCTLANSSNHTV